MEECRYSAHHETVFDYTENICVCVKCGLVTDENLSLGEHNHAVQEVHKNLTYCNNRSESQSQIRKEIFDIAETFHIHCKIAERAVELYEKRVEKLQGRKFDQHIVLLACLHIVCQKDADAGGISLHEWKKLTSFERRKVRLCSELLRQDESIHERTNPSTLCARLLPFVKFERAVLHTADEIYERNCFRSRTLIAYMYYYYAEVSEKPSIAQVCREVGVSTTAFHKAHHDISLCFALLSKRAQDEVRV